MKTLAVERTKAEEAIQDALHNYEMTAAALAAARAQQSTSQLEAEQVALHAIGISLVCCTSFRTFEFQLQVVNFGFCCMNLSKRSY